MIIALLQINSIVGDLEGNSAKIIDLIKKFEKNIDLFVTPELALLGYPPRDLLLYPSFILKAAHTLEKLARELKSYPPTLIGSAVVNENHKGRPLFNSAVLIQKGKVQDIFYKSLLPTYDVFDEDRYFEPVKNPQILKLNGKRIGISICEDLWNDKDFWERPRYNFDPIKNLVKEQIDLIINLSASPYAIGKQKLREKMIASSVKKYKVPIVYINQVGGNDDLIFDGSSIAFNGQGKLVARGKAFEEDIVIVNLNESKPKICSYPFREESIYKALVIGVRDYVEKTGFNKTILGLSGGIDSALTATLAVSALGPQNVIGVLMSSPYTAQQSVKDAKKLADNLKIETLSIGIEKIMNTFEDSLKSAFLNLAEDVTEQNLQSRIRGSLLMALSNKYNALVLATGNKSELTVGYSTLYGDTVGALAPIGDLTKTDVYKVSSWINRNKQIIPQNILKKAPTAELKPNQKDQDDLPPYNQLDKILELHVEKQLGATQIITKGYKKDLVENILSMVKRAEFKRRQVPPTLKVTGRAYGSGWRMPIAASKEIF